MNEENCLPLLTVGGASGTGKSTILEHLLGRIQEAVLLDADILWRPEFDRPEDGYRDFFETWLRLAHNIAQSGRPVVLFGAGFAVPENIERLSERQYFSAVRYLALVCDDAILAERLRGRPAWRNSGSEEFIQNQIHFNQWFDDNAGTVTPPMELVDTSRIPIEEAAARIAAWIRRYAVR